MPLPIRPSFILFALFTFVISFSVYAQNKDPNIDRLEKTFRGILERQAEEAELQDSTLVMEGDVMVEDADTYYAVTLPHLSLEYEDGSRFEIGIIAVNAIPADDGMIKMTVALPTPMTLKEPDGGAAVKIEIGSQNLSGIWHEKMNSFTKLKAQYKDITVRAMKDGEKFIIPDTQTVINLEQNDNGNWTGPIKLDVRDAEIISKAGENVGRFGHIALNSRVIDYSLDTAMKYEENLRALMESYESGDSPSISGQHMSAVYSLVTDVMMNAWDGFETTISVEDIELFTPAKEDAPAEHIKLDKGGFSFDMTGFRDNSVTMRTAFHYDGLDIQPPPEDFSDATPSRMNFDFNIANVPFKEIVDLGKTSIEAGAQNPQMAQMIGLQAMMSIPQLITQAGTKLTIDNSYAGNDIYNILVNGAVTADLKAAFGATGESTVEVFGLDKLIEIYKSRLDDPALTEEEKKVVQENIQKITVLKTVGQQAENEEGQPVRIYKFTLDEKGQTMLNGSNVQDLMGRFE